MKNYERSFASRHIGVTQEETQKMLHKVGAASMDEFIKRYQPLTPEINIKELFGNNNKNDDSNKE